MRDPALFATHFPNEPHAKRTSRDQPTALEAVVMKSRNAARIAVTPGVQTPSLISSYAGSIDELLFTWPPSVFAFPEDRDGFRRLLAALPRGTRFLIAHAESDAQKVGDLLTETGHATHARLVPVVDEIVFTDWAEDAFVGLVDRHDSTRYLREPFSFGRRADSLIADFIADDRDLELRATASPLIFQGGNCLIGDTFWFLGRDYFEDTMSLLSSPGAPARLPGFPDIREEDVVALFGEMLDAGRKLVRIGTADGTPGFAVLAVQENGSFLLDYGQDGTGAFQPIFHIDMFMTLAGRAADGRFRVLVGSPKLAVEQAGIPACPDDLQNSYDEIAASLPAGEVEVIRNPLAILPRLGEVQTLAKLKADTAARPESQRAQYEQAIRDFEAMGATDASEIHPRTWYHATWNNCLVQESATAGNHVYFPTYANARFPQLAVLDRWMEGLWRDELGFTPHPLGDFHAFARRQGVVHCIKKYVARGR